MDRLEEVRREYLEARHVGAIGLRDEVRAIMRGEHSNNAIAEDLIREVIEWDRCGRPTATGVRREIHGEVRR